VHGLTNGQLYTFTIVAISDSGTSPPSNPTAAVRPAGRPLKVRNVDAAPRRGAALVTWAKANGNGAKVLHYRIATSTGRVIVVGGKARSALIKHLKPRSKVRFRVRAVNRVGAGPWSAWSARVKIK
jgi:hypothetical protein